MLVGSAAYFIAAPRAGNCVVFTAIIVASATNVAVTFANIVAIVADDVRVDANVVARPATLVVVVGVVAESPGLTTLANLSDFDVRPGAAECFVAAPGVVIVAVFAAVVEASATCGVKAVSNVVAVPATIVVVLGVVVEPP